MHNEFQTPPIFLNNRIYFPHWLFTYHLCYVTRYNIRITPSTNLFLHSSDFYMGFGIYKYILMMIGIRAMAVYQIIENYKEIM